jgi:hypothetical protein
VSPAKPRPAAAAAGDATAAPQRQSAAMPSPFTPIADYAFLSNCHTGAVVAPGRIILVERTQELQG